jgi:hypothetical protein
VVINLRDGISMAKSSQAFSVCLKDLLIDRRKMLFQPGEERGTKIEADGGVIIDDLQDLPFFIKDPGISIWPIALQSDPFIPVMKGMGAFLRFNEFKPRVLPGRLIEMTVNGDISVFDFWQDQFLIYFFWCLAS